MTTVKINIKLLKVSDIKKVKIESTGRKRISYSQFSSWYQCPQKWKYDYMDGLSVFENNVHCVFGTAIHESMQTYIQELYTKGSAAADSVDMIGIFEQVFATEMKGEKNVSVKDENGDYVLDSKGEKTWEKICSPVEISDEDLATFIGHGHAIIKSFTSAGNRQKYFPNSKYELVGIETPLKVPIMQNLEFIGYLDIVLKDKATGKIKIIDLKTSTRMWNKYQQNDMGKLMQLLFYKTFYSKQFDVPLNKIEVEFLVLKRTLLEGVSFPESRFQKITPPSGKMMVDDAVSELVNFVENSFTENGEHNKEAKFRKNPHKGKTRYSNCKYCEYSVKKGGDCDRKEGFPDDESDKNKK